MRPAFNLDLTSVLFTSAAVGGKADSTVDGNLTEVAAYDGNEWKLTLKDGDRSGFTASTTSATTQVENYSNWTVDVAYSGAQTGSNEYVSAMLVDSSGSVLYYGRVAQNSASGEASINIPTGLAVGSYTLKVFSEQYNGDKKTDYASAFTDISLTVTAPATDPGSSGSGSSGSGSTAPSITWPTAPQEVGAAAGSPLTFSVESAEGSAYQWYVDAGDGRGFQPIAGATGASLALWPTQGDGGEPVLLPGIPGQRL